MKCKWSDFWLINIQRYRYKKVWHGITYLLVLNLGHLQARSAAATCITVVPLRRRESLARLYTAWTLSANRTHWPLPVLVPVSPPLLDVPLIASRDTTLPMIANVTPHKTEYYFNIHTNIPHSKLLLSITCSDIQISSPDIHVCRNIVCKLLKVLDHQVSASYTRIILTNDDSFSNSQNFHICRYWYLDYPIAKDTLIFLHDYVEDEVYKWWKICLINNP